MTKNFLKKCIAMLLVGTMLSSLPIHAQAAEIKENQNVEQKFDSYSDPVLSSMIKEYGFTKEQVNKIDEELDELVTPRTSIGAIIGIVVGVVGLTGVTYEAGRYAARQCEVRLGLTKSEYRANGWAFRAALSGLVFAGGGTGAVVALGFDDYYMGV